MRTFTLLALVLGLVLADHAAAVTAPDAGDVGRAATVHLVLQGGVPVGQDGRTADLVLDLMRVDGQWRTDVYGMAPERNRAEHFGQVQRLREDGATVTAEVLLELDGDAWVKGYLTTYRLEFQMRNAAVEGRYWTTMGGKEISNTLTGQVLPWPSLPPGFAPPALGEHPRLLLRKSEVPALRKLAETERGKALVALMQAAKKGDPGMARTTNVYLPKDIPDYGLKMGLLYLITGDQTYADRCKEVIEETMALIDTGTGSGQNRSTWWTVVALTFDLAYDGLTPEFRTRISRSMRAKVVSNVLRSTKASWVNPNVYLSVAAAWDEPLSLAAEPAEPAMARPAPPAALDVPAGVPVVPLAPGQTITDWLLAGPFVAYVDREDSLVLKDRRALPSPGPHFQADGQDFLATLGGWRAARPTPEAMVDYQGRRATFGPVAAKAMQRQGAATVLDVWTAHGDVPVSTGYYYAVLENRQAGWYTVLLEPEAPAARAFDAGVAPGDAALPYRLDADLSLAGQEVHHGDAVYLAPGRYPMMLRATTHQQRVQLQPRLVAVTEAQAQADQTARMADFPARHRQWELQFDYYYRRPIYEICRRVLERRELWLEHDESIATVQEGCDPWTICILNMASVAHLNITGRPLSYAPLRLSAYTTVGCGTDDEFATGFRAVPNASQPGVLWEWQRRPDYGQNVVFGLLSLLTAAEPRNPLGVVPNPFRSELTGLHVFRNAWKDKDDCVADVYFKSWSSNLGVRPNAGSFRIRGLGHEWAWRGRDVYHLIGLGLGVTYGNGEVRLWQENVIQFPEDPTNTEAGGRVIQFSGQADGSGVVTADMGEVVTGAVKPMPSKGGGFSGALWDQMGRVRPDQLRDLGIRWQRSFAVDYSGASGAPALFATADITSGGKRKYWQMLVAEDPEVTVDGQTFTLRHKDGTTLVGTVVSPQKAKVTFVNGATSINAVRLNGAPATWTPNLKAIQVEGGDDFLIVMTLQKGAAPEAKVNGAGRAATAQIGRRTVAYDGKTVVLRP